MEDNMKSIKFKKNLKLNKQTISHLDSIQMKNIEGGIPDTIYCGTKGPGSCPTICETMVDQNLCPGWQCNTLGEDSCIVC